MRGLRSRRATAIVVFLVVSALAGIPAAFAADVPIVAPPDGETADLSIALAPDGTFVGGASGTVDTDIWSLTSDLAAGEPPRFEPAVSQSPTPGTVEWSALGSNGAGNGAWAGNGVVLAVAVSGSNVYVGGFFSNAAGIPEADGIARWDGTAWSALGSNGTGVGPIADGSVRSLAVAGTVLFVGGLFFNAGGIPEADNLARWDGTGWSALGSTSPGDSAIHDHVYALAVSGNDLYAGGEFTNAAGIAEADRLAHWNGSAWAAIGSAGAGVGALNAQVRTVSISGSNVYVGGSFTNAANINEADYVARWNGSAWSALGSNGVGVGALGALVLSSVSSGSDLYVGGNFTNAQGIGEADYLARWNGTTWSAVGSSGAGIGALNGTVGALAISGTDLYVGGSFTNAAGIAAADYVARWDSGTWLSVGSNGAGDGALGATVFALAASGSALYTGGSAIDAAGIPEADFVAVAVIFGPWAALGSNSTGNGALNNLAFCFAVSGTNLYVGGLFTNVAGIPEADFVARWDGSSWSALGSNGVGVGALNGSANAVAVSGNNLFVGGAFTDAGGVVAADRVARWDGNTWSALGAGGALNASVGALAISGSDLYVGGSFTNAAGIAEADVVALWNGVAWSALGSSGPGAGALLGSVSALAMSGSDLYVGGSFGNAAEIAEADNIARWNGSAWSAVGTTSALNGAVFTFAVAGTDLYVGGNFTNAAGIPEGDRIVRWNGNAWSALGAAGAGVGALSNFVRALAVVGSDVFVGGAFLNAGGDADADRIARWNGSAWSALVTDGALISDQVRALAIGASDLYVGGDFANADGIPKADSVATYGPLATYQPDGRIKKGKSALLGNDIYNSDGTNQTKSGKASVGNTITFTISIQNDGDDTDKFTVFASGTAAANYQVKYFKGTTDITAAVVAGTYETTNLAPGAASGIKAKVKVLAGATVGSSVARLVTLTSVADGTAIDAVKFTAKRS